MKKNDEVLSLEQMRILLHISKRKAAWMLQNQVIPCIVNEQMTTHKYMVRREDVEAFLRLPAAEQQARIPVGQFTSGYQCKPVSNVYAYSIPDTERDRFTQYLDDLFSDKPNALTINMACSMTGYSATTLNRWIDAGLLFAAWVFDGPRIPKSTLVSFLASDYAFRIHQKSEVHTAILEKWMEESDCNRETAR